MKFVWQGLITNCSLCPFTCELLYREQRILTINLQVKWPIATYFTLVAFYSSLNSHKIELKTKNIWPIYSLCFQSTSVVYNTSYISNHEFLKKIGMWRILLFYGIQISVCLSLSGFLFEDNKTSKRWVDDNGEITYRLSRWYEKIGYVQVLNIFYKEKSQYFLFRCCFTSYVNFDRYSSIVTFVDFRFFQLQYYLLLQIHI